MNTDKTHDDNFEKICNQHEDLIISLKAYMLSRRDTAKVGETSIQHDHKMICIAPSTNRGPFWAVEGLNAWFNLHTGQRFNHPLKIYTTGYCLKIYSNEKLLKMLIIDERSDINGKVIFLPIEHIGRYFLTERSDDQFTHPLLLSKYPNED